MNSNLSFFWNLVKKGCYCLGLGIFLGLISTQGLGLIIPSALAQSASTPTLASFPDLHLVHQRYPQALAMGSAYGPVANGNGAMWYNPAGLMQSQLGFNFTLDMFGTGTSLNFGQDMADIVSTTISPTSAQAFLDKYTNSDNTYALTGAASVVLNFPYFALGVAKTADALYFLSIKNTSPSTPPSLLPSTTLLLNGFTLEMDTVSAAFGLMEQQLLLGVTYRGMKYKHTFFSQSSQQFITSGKLKPSAKPVEYKGSAVDVGMIYRVSYLPYLRPQVSLVGIGVSTSNPKSSTTTVELPTTYNLGFRINPSVISRPHDWIVSLELEDVGGKVKRTSIDPTDTETKKRSWKQRLHVGTSLGIFRTRQGEHLISLRSGINRGKTTYGVEFNFFSYMKFSYTKWKTDYGYDGNSQIQEYTTAMLSFGVDY